MYAYQVFFSMCVNVYSQPAYSQILFVNLSAGEIQFSVTQHCLNSVKRNYRE